jgi:(1->4)-alpha-D-glucan 1-alpha-D-glucosylmutase
VDYAERTSVLAADHSLADLLGQWRDGGVKLRLAADLLRDRRDHAAFYAHADYVPLTVTGEKWENVLGFARRHKNETLVVIVPRLSGRGNAASVMPVGQAYWANTMIDLPAGRWRSIFEDRTHETSGSTAVGGLLATLPFAVLRTAG